MAIVDVLAARHAAPPERFGPFGQRDQLRRLLVPERARAPPRRRPGARRPRPQPLLRFRRAGTGPYATALDGGRTPDRWPTGEPDRAGRPTQPPPSGRRRRPPRGPPATRRPPRPEAGRTPPSRTGWRWWPGRREVVGQQHEDRGRRRLLHRLQAGRAPPGRPGGRRRPPAPGASPRAAAAGRGTRSSGPRRRPGRHRFARSPPGPGGCRRGPGGSRCTLPHPPLGQSSEAAKARAAARLPEPGRPVEQIGMHRLAGRQPELAHGARLPDHRLEERRAPPGRRIAPASATETSFPAVRRTAARTPSRRPHRRRRCRRPPTQVSGSSSTSCWYPSAGPGGGRRRPSASSRSARAGPAGRGPHRGARRSAR